MDLRPSEIRFKQDSIKKAFQNGKGVNDTALQLCCHDISVDDFPPISVAKKNNKYYSFDNRRLYVFRVAEYNGAISRIRVRIAPSYRFDEDTFTTTDDGRTVEVRYDRTLPHCKPEWLPVPTSLNMARDTWGFYTSAGPGQHEYVPETVAPRQRSSSPRIEYYRPSTDTWSNPRSNDSVCSCTIL